MKINKKYVTSVEVIPAKRSSEVKWRDEERILWGLLPWSPAGWYYNFWGSQSVDIDSLMCKGCYYIGSKVLYVRPYVRIGYLSGNHRAVYFDTVEEARDFVNTQLKGIEWVNTEK